MSIIPWNCAHGEAAPAILRCDSTVAIAPADDSVDTNSVIIEGAGTINSFGDCPHVVMKRVRFVPLVMATRAPPGGGGGGGATIVLVNSVTLNLLDKRDRPISDISYGMYQCDGRNHWDEVYFAQRGEALLSQLLERLEKLEARVRMPTSPDSGS